MNTNQFNLFQSWKWLYTFIAVLFKLFDRIMWRIKLPSSRRRWGKQPAKMNNFLGLAPSSPASSIPAAYVLPFVSNFHQDWNLNSPFWSASSSGWIMGVANGCPWSVWLNQVTCLRLVLVAPLPWEHAAFCKGSANKNWIERSNCTFELRIQPEPSLRFWN